MPFLDRRSCDAHSRHPPVLCLALFDARIKRFPRWLGSLGDVSYSSYLWRFPLQVAVAALAASFDCSVSIFNDTVTLIVFFVLLIAVSRLSFRWIEMPAQGILRRRWLSRRSQGA